MRGGGIQRDVGREAACAASVWLVLMACAPPAPQPRTRTAPAPPPAAPAPRPRPTTATAVIRDLAGGRVGTATFTDTHAGVLIAATVTGLGLGAHAVHIHAAGRCVPPFETAGGHFNPGGRQHGFENASGAHAGDLPNIDMPAAGKLHFEVLMPGLTLRGPGGLLGPAGAAIVFHTSGDDYRTDPGGNAGSRQACGVIVAR